MYMNNRYSLCCLLLLHILGDWCALALDDYRFLRREDGDSADVENLRVLTFGMSTTWGAGLESRFEAYPYLLSSQATNVAQRATGPNYPSVCTETMIGGSVYDVIILEYFYRAYDGMIPLARRLRQRFPDATIIFLQLWNPKMATYKQMSLDSWLSTMGVTGKDPKALQELEKTSSKHWRFSVRYMEECMSFAEEGAKEVNGHVLRGPPFPTNRYDNVDVKDLLLATSSLYSSDWFHLSKKGHELVAQGIKELLLRVKPKRSISLGSWGQGDSCHNWFESGDFRLGRSAGVALEKVKSNKFAVEIPTEGGYLVVNNPFDTPRQLILTYMTTGPRTSIYPKTRVSISWNQNNYFDDSQEPITLNPINRDYNFPVHVASSKNVGVVHPGDNTVSINPLEFTEAPFRIIAVSVVGDEQKTSRDFIGMKKTLI